MTTSKAERMWRVESEEWRVECGVWRVECEICRRFAEAARCVFGDALTGVYLHGSAAMGCYNPAVSDLDFIVVVQKAVSDEARRAFMARVAALDGEAPGKGIEMSVVLAGVCRPFVYPTPFELHWSRMHAAWYRRDPEDYVQKMRGTDADLAAHFTVIRQRGICLLGAPVGDVFAPVPEADYLDSIWDDVAGAAEEIAGNTMYYALNLARVLAYLKDRKVLSKREGGEWALENLPQYRGILRAALEEYETGAKGGYDVAAARDYARDMLRRIRGAKRAADAR